MLWNASKLNGYTIAASDGHLGTVSDVLFDDATWSMRWLVVDTGHWLPGRKVMLPPSALGRSNREDREFSVKLTKEQVKNSPEINTDRPVSRQMETHIYHYYGWGPYWGGGLGTGGFGYLGMDGYDGYLGGPSSDGPYIRPSQHEDEMASYQRSDGDPHLRSTGAVIGYHIHATDGMIGHVAEFLVEDTNWSIRYFVVDTKNWWPGKKVLISPRSARDIDWNDRLVSLSIDRATVRGSPEYDAATIFDQVHEDNGQRHDGEVQSTPRP
jgi:PRC-barrel domain